MFYFLSSFLVVFILAFILFMVFIRKMKPETFKRLCEKKVRRFAKRNDLLCIEKLNIENFQRENIELDHVIFGKKYIYVISDSLLHGFVKGEANDNSWVYYNVVTKKPEYTTNLNNLSMQNIQEFAGILGINSDPIIAICVVPNECDFSVKDLENDKVVIVHYSSLNKKIKEFEKRNIGTLNEKQIYVQYSTIKERNEKF